MNINNHVNILKNGINTWNLWRKENPDIMPNLRSVNFYNEFKTGNNIYGLPHFENGNFKNTNLFGASLRNSTFINCFFDNSQIHNSDLVDAYFEKCSFINVGMRVSRLGNATFRNCTFKNVDMSYCSANDTNFEGSHFSSTFLQYGRFVSNNFKNTIMERCHVYGISIWDLDIENSIHKNFIITKNKQSKISVDNLELAQFIYLLINNQKLREIIDTITSKVVLILGNFSKERKKVLDNIKNILSKNDLVPILFDFEKPSSRNLTETIFTLAHMSKFVIADLSKARSIPHELSAVIPRLQSVNFYPIIFNDEKEYEMFEEFKGYSWVKSINRYNKNNVLKVIEEIVIDEK